MTKFYSIILRRNCLFLLCTLLFLFANTDVSAQTVTTITSSQTWQVPTGVTSVNIYCWGAGGGSGGTISNANDQAGGGGGGGAFSGQTFTVTPGQSLTITIGAGGTAGANTGTAGGTGGSTSVTGTSPTVSITALGGGGGGGAATAGAAGTAGAGGAASAYTIAWAGGNGTVGVRSTTDEVGGAGGGGAGSASAGSPGTAGTTGGTNSTGGTGGTGTYPGGAGAGATNTTGSIAGVAGTAPGGGAAGAASYTTKEAGAVGGAGQVVLIYTLPACTAPSAPTALTLTPSAGNVTGTFTAPGTTPSGYLVIRTTTATAPTNPAQGTTYTVGTTALGGYIVSTNTTTGFTDNTVASATQYWYWVYSYNNSSCSIAYSSTYINGTTNTPAVITSSGSFTVPAGVTSITVYTWGGGGGGGGGGNSDAADDGNGGGGGGGGFASSTLSVTPGQVYTVTVGAAGTGGAGSTTTTAAGNGITGGTTTFTGNGYTVSATGGSGGTGANTTGATFSGGAGGTGANGTTIYTGGTGSQGYGNTSTSGIGTGGGGAGSGSNGSSPANGTCSATGGAGGTGTYPGGLGGYNTSCASTDASAAGVAGALPGGGGSGAGSYSTAESGGAGGAGEVIVTYTISSPPTITSFTPTSACSGSGTSVTITGTNFTGATVVKFNGTPATTFSVVSATSITAALPAGATTGVITITAPGGTATSSSSFTVTALPTITLGSNPSVCYSTSLQTVNFTYSATSGTPTTYSISGWSGGSFATVTNAALPTSPIVVTVPASTPANTYTATLTVNNGTCTSINYTINITVNAQPTVTSLSYSGSPYCSSVTSASPSLTASSTSGTYSYSVISGGPTLSIVPATGVINPSASSVGTYLVTYTLTATGCTTVSQSTSVTIIANTAPTITLGANPAVCYSASSQTANLTYSATSGTPTTYSISGWSGGGFANVTNAVLPSSPIGITVPASTPANTYSATLTVNNGTCSGTSYPISVTVTAPPTITSFSYAGTPYCTTTTSASPSLTASSTTGTYSYSVVIGGPVLNIVTSTGVINPSTSSAGTYTITYTIAAAGGCSSISQQTTVVISSPPTITSFSYSGTPFCTSAGTVSPSLTASSSTGTYSYTGGGTLSLNTSTGVITPSTSSAGTYSITYTIPATSGCSAVSQSTSVTITALPTITSFSYPSTPYCTSVTSASPSLTASSSSGTYSYTGSGTLSLNTSTGVINPSTSTAGTYTITYTIAAAGGCAAVAQSTLVTITALPTITSFSYAGTPFCATTGSSSPTLTASSSTGTYSYTGSGTLSLSASTGVINPSASSAGTYTVTYTIAAASGCSAVSQSTSVTINAVPVITGQPSNQTACTAGSAVSFSVTASGTSPTYQWQYSTNNVSFTNITNGTTGGFTFAGATTSTLSVTAGSSVAAGTYYTRSVVTVSGCASVNSNSATLTVLTGLSGLTYSPSSVTVCANSSFTSATPTLTGTGTISYSISPSLPSGVTLNTSTGVISGTLTSVASSTYTITASNGCSTTLTTITLTVSPNPATPTISPASTAMCSSAIQSLGVPFGFNLSPSGITGANNVTNSSFNYPNPLNEYYLGEWTQCLVSASQLTSLGYIAGSKLTALALTTSTSNSSPTLTNFTISMGLTSQTALTATFITGLTQVYSNAAYQPVTGVNTWALSTPFYWDGSSNVVVEFIFDGNGAISGEPANTQYIPGATTYYTPTSTNNLSYYTDPTANSYGSNAALKAAGTTAGTPTTEQPNITFTGINPTTTWSPSTYLYINSGATTAYTTGTTVSTVYAKPTAPGSYTYTATATNSGSSCSSTSSASIVVNPLPTATISGSTAVCVGAASPGITFTGANGTAPYTFYYTLNGVSHQITTTSGNTATEFASTSTAGTFTYALVSVADASSTNCNQSQSGSATVTVNSIPTATISGTAAVCVGSSSPNITFTGASGTAPYTFNYSINGTAQTPVTTTSGNSVTVAAPTTAAGTFTYTLTGVISSTTCPSATLSSTATITVNPLPTATITGATSVCANGTAPNITFTGANGTAPYTFTYTINGVAQTPVTTTSGNSISVAVPMGTAGTFTYTLVSVQDASSSTCTNPQSGSAAVVINPVPTATISSSSSVCVGSASPNVIFTGAGGTTPYTFTYTLNGMTHTISTTSGNSSASIAVSTAAPGTFIYALVSVKDASSTTCSQNQTGSDTVTVNRPVAITTQPANATTCATYPVTFSVVATGDSLNYQWYFNGSALTDNGHITGSQTANLTIGQAGTADAGSYYVIVSGAAACNVVTSNTVTLSVNQQINITAQPANQALCSGSTATFTISASGTIFYQWRIGATNLTDGGNISGSNTSTLTITNATAANAATNYNVLLTSPTGACPQAISKYDTLTVNPIPTVNAVSNQTFCSGAASSVTFSGSTAGTVYSWTNSNTAIGLGASGTGNLSFTAANSGTAPISATITVTPSYTNAGVTCTGSPITFSITVNPSAVTNTVANQTLCNGGSTTAVNFSSTATGGTIVYNWVNNTPSIGLASSGSGNINSFSAVNSTASPVTATITVTASYTNSGATCSGTPMIFTITVNPSASVNAVANQTVCNGSSTTGVTFSSPSTGGTIVYNWVNNTPSIGLAASGSGNIAAFTANNTTYAPVTATITVTPSYTNGTTCPGLARIFTITVNPTPNTIATPTSQSLCSGSTSSIALSGSVTGTGFAWTVTPTGVSGASASSGTSIAQTLTATGTAQGTAAYSVTPSANGCSGTPLAVTVTVNPFPTVSPLAQNTCSGASMTPIAVSGAVAGSITAWTRTSPSGITPASGSGSGTISGTLTNSNTSSKVVSYSITATSTTGGCVASFTATDTVYAPYVAPTIGSNQFVCTGNSSYPTTTSPLTMSPDPSGGSPYGYTYTWQNSANGTSGWANIAGASGTTDTTYTPPVSNEYYQLVVTNSCGSVISNSVEIQTASAYGTETTGSGSPSTICSGDSFLYDIEAISNNSEGYYNWTSGKITGTSYYIEYSWQSQSPGYYTSYTTNPYPTGQSVITPPPPPAKEPIEAWDGQATFTAHNSTSTPITENLIITPGVYSYATGALLCNLSPSTVTIIIEPIPVIGNYTDTICSGSTFNITPVNGSPTAATIVPTGTTYTWNAPSVAGITGTAGNSSASSISGTLTNTTNAPINVTYTVTPFTTAGCSNTPFTVTVTVNPTPTIANYTTTICSGSMFSITPTNGSPTSATVVPANTKYTWSAPVVSGITGTVSGSAQSSISGTLTNTTSNPINVVYTVSPSSTYGCSPSAFTVTVTVNPTPIIGNYKDTICSGSSFSVTPINGSPTAATLIPGGTTYSWSAPSVTGITGTASGSAQSAIAGTLTNTTNAPISVVYAVTPLSGSCSGISFNVTVTVNPAPAIPNYPVTVCNGNAFSITPTNGSPTAATIIPAGTTYSWSSPVVTGGITGGSAQSGQASISQLLANPSNSSQTATYTVTPSTYSTCPGNTFTVTVTVNPGPAISNYKDTICSGSSFSVTPVTGTPAGTVVPSGTTYSWSTPAAAGITGLASGSAQLSVGGTLTNTTNAPVNVVYTVTPSSAYSCSVSSFTVTVTVNPMPAIANYTPAAICSGSSFSVTPANGSPTAATVVPAGTTYSWGSPAVTGGITGGSAQSSQASISQVLTNPSAGAQTATYTVTPLSATCTGNTFTVTVTVNPSVTAGTISGTTPLCSGSTATFSATGATAGGTWASSIPGVASVNFSSGLVTALGVGTTSITYTVSSGCGAPVSASLSLTVNPQSWTGVVSSDWNNAANWCGGIPTISTNVTIPAGTPNNPVISTAVATANNVTIASGATLTITANTLEVAGTLSSPSGAINSANGTIEMMGGSSAQTLDGSWFTSRSINSLIDSTINLSLAATASDTLRITNTLSFGKINNATFTTSGNLTLASTSSFTARLADITNGWANSGNTVSGNVTVERYYPSHRSWRLVTAPVKNSGAPTINASWQEGSVNTSNTTGGIVNPHPGYGTLITGPYSGTGGYSLGFDPGTEPNASILYFNGGNWLVPSNTNSTSIKAQPGWMLFVRGSRNYIIGTQYTPSDTAKLRATGALNIGSQAISGNGETVVGNPYASNIFYDSIFKRGTNTPDYYYVWDPLIAQTGPGTGVGGFITYSYTSPYTYVAVPDPSQATGSAYHYIPHNGDIESGQAFIINFAVGAGSTSIQETDKDALSTDNQDYFFRPVAPSPSTPLDSTTGSDSTDTSATQQFRANLYAVNSDGSTSLEDGVLDLYNNAYTDSVNLLQDAPKLGNFDETMAILRDGYYLAIEKRKIIGVTDTVFYGLYGLQEKNYILEFIADSLNHPGLAGFIVDSFLKTRTPVNLNGTTDVPFTITGDPASYAHTRFTAIFIPAAGGPLPVTFTGVKAWGQGDGNIAVQWQVTNQLNIKEYEVEKSTDGHNFTVVYTTAATGGNTATILYNWVDSNAAGGDNFYRIIAVNASGTLQYSSVVMVNIAGGQPAIAVYPNPIQNGVIGLQMKNMAKGTYNTRLLTTLGQVIFTKAINYPGGTAIENVPLLKGLAKGSYNLEITGPDNSITTLKILN